jgi:hypothetical protein
VSLPLLNVGILGSVTMDVAPPYQAALKGISFECLSPNSSWWDGLSGLYEFSNVVLPGEGM